MLNFAISKAFIWLCPPRINQNDKFMSIETFYYSVFKGVRKNQHFPYFVRGFARMMVPRFLTVSQREGLLRRFDRLTPTQQTYVMERVDYYNRLSQVASLPSDSPRLGEQHYFSKKYSSVYFFDSYEWNRYFPEDLHWSFAPGDVTRTFSVPTVTKSRPIEECRQNPNSVIINMEKVRHFMFFNDPIPFDKKEDRAIFRGAIHGKPARMNLIENFFGHPRLDILDTSSNSIYPPNMRQHIETTIYDHLRFKYIFSLEGNDVASNLKWVMHSNSLAVSPPMRHETWFMEGRLVPGEHYVGIKPDFSDIVERMEYYDSHPNEARDIVENAHAYCRQFFDKDQEKLISLMVMDKYFRMTGQL